MVGYTPSSFADLVFSEKRFKVGLEKCKSDHPALMNAKIGANEEDENEGETLAMTVIPTQSNFPSAQQCHYSTNNSPSHLVIHKGYPKIIHKDSPQILVSYANFLPYLLDNAMVAITPARVPQPPFFRGDDSNATCAYHGGVLGHSIEHCMTSKRKGGPLGTSILTFRGLHTLAIRGLHVLAFRGLHVLIFRGLHVLAIRGLHALAIRGLHVLAFRGLHALAFKGLHILAFVGLRALTFRGLHALTFRGLHVVAFRGLHALAFRGLHVLAFTGLHTLAFRGLHVLAFRGLHVLPFKGLHVLTFIGLHVLPFRGLHVLAFRGLPVLTFRGLHTLHFRGLHIFPFRELHVLAIRGLHVPAFRELYAIAFVGLHALTFRGLHVLTFRGLHALAFIGLHALAFIGLHICSFKELKDRVHKTPNGPEEVQQGPGVSSSGYGPLDRAHKTPSGPEEVQQGPRVSSSGFGPLSVLPGIAPARHLVDSEKSNRVLGFPALITGLFQFYGLPVALNKAQGETPQLPGDGQQWAMHRRHLQSPSAHLQRLERCLRPMADQQVNKSKAKGKQSTRSMTDKSSRVQLKTLKKRY
ncbi:Dynein heavy chain [Glycine soja]